MDRLQLVALLAVVLLVTLVGCETGTDNTSSGEKTAGSYEWARKLANEVRDTEMPDGILFEVWASLIDKSGLISGSATWTFSYYDAGTTTAAFDCLTINVDASGETSFSAGDWVEGVEDGLPTYKNSEVSSWITTMDSAVNEDSLDYDYRRLGFASGSVGFPDIDNLSAMMYIKNDVLAAMVAINADTLEVLFLEFY